MSRLRCTRSRRRIDQVGETGCLIVGVRMIMGLVLMEGIANNIVAMIVGTKRIEKIGQGSNHGHGLPLRAMRSRMDSSRERRGGAKDVSEMPQRLLEPGAEKHDGLR